MFQKYRRKPTTVEAIQWDGTAMLGVTRITDEGKSIAAGYVTTIQGQDVLISVGEWIAKEADGIHYYPIADQVFRAIYEPETSTPPGWMGDIGGTPYGLSDR